MGTSTKNPIDKIWSNTSKIFQRKYVHSFFKKGMKVEYSFASIEPKDEARKRYHYAKYLGSSTQVYCNGNLVPNPNKVMYHLFKSSK